MSTLTAASPSTEPPKLATSAQRAVAASLLEMTSRIGAETDDGLVYLPAPLAELSAESGRHRNCGTVYHHVRALGSAVRRVPGRTGMLVDTAALRAITDQGPTPNPLPRCTTRPLRPPRLPPPPPIQRHPTERSDAGYPEDRSAEPALSPGSTGEIVGLVRDVIALVYRLVQRTDSAELDDLRDEIARLAIIADYPRPESRTIRDVADHLRLAEPPPDQREGGRFSPKSPAKDPSPSLPDLREPIRDIRDPVRESREPIRDIRDPLSDPRPTPQPPDRFSILPETGRPRTVEEMEVLIGPLSRLAQRSNLVGVTDPEMLQRALSAYDDAQVRYAVAQTAAMVKAGSVTKSPIGWLVNKARSGDEAFFPPPHVLAKRNQPTSPSARAGPLDEPDTEAELAVTDLETSPADLALDELDKVIRAGRYAERILNDPGSLHAARVLQWRRQHPHSPTAKKG